MRTRLEGVAGGPLGGAFLGSEFLTASLRYVLKWRCWDSVMELRKTERTEGSLRARMASVRTGRRRRSFVSRLTIWPILASTSILPVVVGPMGMSLRWTTSWKRKSAIVRDISSEGIRLVMLGSQPEGGWLGRAGWGCGAAACAGAGTAAAGERSALTSEPCD